MSAPETRLLGITGCYQCSHGRNIECRCKLTARKNNRYPAIGFPKWCPLPLVWRGKKEKKGGV